MAIVTSVTKHFPTAKEGFTTTLASTIGSGAATVPLNSVTGYANGDQAVFVVEPASSTAKQAVTGTVDTAGVQLTGAVWTEGTNTTHSAGATVVDYVAATHMSMVTKGLLVSHNQDGTIKNNAITSAAQITDGVIGDAEMATAVKPVTLFNENMFDHVVSGCVWTADAAGSTRLASMTSGVAMISGKRLTVAAVTSRTFTASRDVYVDFTDNADGTVLPVYTDNTTNVASPALAAGFRQGIVVVGASSIATAASINQGQESRVLPIVSSVPYQVTDGLGNLICPRDPLRKLLGYRQRITNVNIANTTATQINELSSQVIVPADRKVKVSAHYAGADSNSGGLDETLTIWDGTVGSGTLLTSGRVSHAGTGFGTSQTLMQPVTLSAGSHTINVGFHVNTSQSNIVAASTGPFYVMVELE